MTSEKDNYQRMKALDFGSIFRYTSFMSRSPQ
jgi:hypothetical protein